MAISNLTTGLRPGVCTSLTRPTAPYEGQVIYETDTDLSYVWGGSAWQQVSGGTAVGNSGLVYVKSQTIGSGVSSVPITNAFSSTYDNYRIQIVGGVANVPQAIRLVMGATTTGNLYDYVFQHHNFVGTPSVTATSTANQWDYLGESSTTSVLTNCDIFFPNLAQYTYVSANYVGSVMGFFNGRLRNTTQYTDCTFKVDGTFTGGTITVYGYRKA